MACAVVLSAVLLTVGCTRTQPPADVKYYSLDQNNPGSRGVIQVYEGDTLYNIAKRYNLPMREIIEENNISAPYTISVGQRLALPAPQAYRVRQNDSYASIARLHNLSVTELVRLNRASEPYILNEGQTVYLSKSKNYYEPVSKPQRKTVVANNVVTPSKKVLTKAQRQSVKSTVKLSKPPARSGSAFDWPVRGRLVSSYGSKKDGLFNDGINIAAPKGTAVRASENGVVAYAGDDLKGFGNLVLVKHDDGYVTAYAHLDSMLAKKGQVISRGETLGTVGSTGSVDTPQLHFEVRRKGKAINPKQYLSRS